MEVVLDEPRLVANEGLILVATSAARLGTEGLVDDMVDLGDRVGGWVPAGPQGVDSGARHVRGADHIDHVDMLRAGATGEVVGRRVMAPSTIGTWLRSFTFGHVRRLEAVLGVLIARAWKLGGGPSEGPLVIDVDSMINQVSSTDNHVYSTERHGAAYARTKVLGYHTLIATGAETGEVLVLGEDPRPVLRREPPRWSRSLGDSRVRLGPVRHSAMVAHVDGVLGRDGHSVGFLPRPLSSTNRSSDLPHGRLTPRAPAELH